MDELSPTYSSLHTKRPTADVLWGVCRCVYKRRSDSDVSRAVGYPHVQCSMLGVYARRDVAVSSIDRDIRLYWPHMPSYARLRVRVSACASLRAQERLMNLC